MIRQTRRNFLFGSSTARFIEYLQVSDEQVIIDVRPITMNIGSPEANNKWMDPSHWLELYAILLECANDHIKSTDKCYELQKAQTPLLKVLYKFKQFKKGYKEVLTTYQYPSNCPHMALDDTEDSAADSQPYYDMVVALVFPGETDVIGFDDVPAYYQPKSKNAQNSLLKRNRSLSHPSRSKSRKGKIKTCLEFREPSLESREPDSKPNFVCPDSDAKTMDPVHDVITEDEYCSNLSDTPDHIFDFEPEEPAHYEAENREERGDSPVRRTAEPESLNVSANFARSPRETGLPNSLCQDSPDMFGDYNSAGSSCKNQRSTAVDGSSSPPRKTCSQPKFPECNSVLEREMSPGGQPPGKSKKLKRIAVPSSSTEDASFPSETNKASQTKSENVVFDSEDRADRLDESPASMSRKPSDILHSTKKNVRAAETNVESEVASVNGTSLLSNYQQSSCLLNESPEGREQKGWEPDIVDDDTFLGDKPSIVKNPLAGEEYSVPSRFPRWSVPSSSESDSDKDPQAAGSKRRKRKLRVSNHKLEQQRNGSFRSMSTKSLQENDALPSKTSKQCLDDEAQSVQSSGSEQWTESDCSPLSQLLKQSLFGNAKEPASSKSDPISTASANEACDLKSATSSQSPKKNAAGSKRSDKQTNAPPRGVRSSPRKVSAVCYAEQGDEKLGAEPSEVATKRALPRNKAQVTSGALHYAKTKSQESVKQKGGQGRGRKGSAAQKRVQKRLSLGSAGKKDSQITDYFGASDKKRAKLDTVPVKTVESDKASTSSLTSKALLLAEAKMEAMCRDLLLSDDDTDSSDGQESKFVNYQDRGPRAKEMAAEKARYVGVVKSLSLDEITKTFNENCATYHGIFKGRVHCVRHELYKAGEEQRLGLRYSTSTNPFTNVQLSHMMDLLTKKFCKENPLYFTDYLWKVLIPELANHVLMAQFDLDYNQSLAKIRDLYKFSYSDSD